MALIERRGKKIINAGRGGVKEHRFSSEREAREMMNRINYLREQNKHSENAEHLRERPIELNSK